MAKNNLVICSVLFACAMFLTIVTPMAFAETHEIQVSDSGFSQATLTVNSGDVVTFVNTHVKANGNIEPHCISDPFAQPYTEESCWIIDGGEPTRSYELSEGQTFYDRYFPDFTPIVVSIGQTTSTTTYEVEEDINSAPEYTGTVNESVLQTNLAEITADLTSALETIGTLQSQLAQKNNQISSLQNEITVLENQVVDVTPYTNQINSLTAERDQWKQTAENWYGIALEQVRVMVEVLGL